MSSVKKKKNVNLFHVRCTEILKRLETFSTRVFALTVNRKRQFQVRRLPFDVYGFYRFSYTDHLKWPPY